MFTIIYETVHLYVTVLGGGNVGGHYGPIHGTDLWEGGEGSDGTTLR